MTDTLSVIPEFLHVYRHTTLRISDTQHHSYQLESGATALLVAAGEGHLGIVKKLLDHGSAVDAIDAWGRTALHYAAAGGHVHILEFLLDSPGGDALLEARTNYGSSASPTMSALSGSGVPSSGHSNVWKGGLTPLLRAAAAGQGDAISTLVSYGADIDARTSGSGWGALHLASYYSHHRCVVKLLDLGCDPTSPSVEGNVPMQCAIPDLRVCTALLGHNVPEDEKDMTGSVRVLPLDSAITFSRPIYLHRFSL